MNDVNKTMEDAFSCDIINDGFDLLMEANLSSSVKNQQFSWVKLPRYVFYIYQSKFAVQYNSSSNVDKIQPLLNKDVKIDKNVLDNLLNNVKSEANTTVASEPSSHHAMTTDVKSSNLVNESLETTDDTDGVMNIELAAVDEFIQQNPISHHPEKSSTSPTVVIMPKPLLTKTPKTDRDFVEDEPFANALSDNIANELQQIDVYNQIVEKTEPIMPQQTTQTLPTPPTPTIPITPPVSKINDDLEKTSVNQLSGRKSAKVSAKARKTKQNFFDRVYTTLLVVLVYMLIGLVIDGAVNIFRSLTSADGSYESFWLFLPLLSILGLILGLFFGAKSLDVLFAMFRSNHTPINNEANFSSGALKSIGLGLLIGFLGWVLLMLFGG